jgi:hypothetical protein
MEMHDGADAIERAWRDGLKPDPLLTVSEWAATGSPDWASLP